MPKEINPWKNPDYKIEIDIKLSQQTMFDLLYIAIVKSVGAADTEPSPQVCADKAQKYLDERNRRMK